MTPITFLLGTHQFMRSSMSIFLYSLFKVSYKTLSVMVSHFPGTGRGVSDIPKYTYASCVNELKRLNWCSSVMIFRNDSKLIRPALHEKKRAMSQKCLNTSPEARKWVILWRVRNRDVKSGVGIRTVISSIIIVSYPCSLRILLRCTSRFLSVGVKVTSKKLRWFSTGIPLKKKLECLELSLSTSIPKASITWFPFS